MTHFHKDVAQCDRIIKGLEGRIAMLTKSVREQSEVLEQRKKEARAMKLALSQGSDYIATLERALHGEVVSFADDSPRMRTVPAGWLLGLREENRRLRDELSAYRRQEAAAS
jgi:hypothetical protein